MDGLGMISPSLLTAQGTPNPRAGAEVAGKAFEEIFASLLLRQMRNTLEEGSMFAGDKSDVLGGLFDHYLGQHIAKSGGLGIGAMIRMQMERQSGRPRAT